MTTKAQSEHDTKTKSHRRLIATCRGCSCTDVRACPGGCWWIDVDYDKGEGLCSNCGGPRRRRRRRAA